MARRCTVAMVLALGGILVAIQSSHALRSSAGSEDGCREQVIRQIYEAQVPERMCGAMLEDAAVPGLLSDASTATPNATPGATDLPKDPFFPEAPAHKDLFPLNLKDALTWSIAVVTLFIAAGGGIGGGGVLVPLYILCWGFETEHAVALSNLTIAGGAFANLWCNIDRRHPAADRPLIYWDLIMVMEPMTIVGAVFGGFLNKLLPVWLTTILLAALLIVMAQKLWQKAASMFHKESMALQELAITATLDEGLASHPVIVCEAMHAGVEEAERGQPLLPDENKRLIDSIMRDGGAMGTRGSPLYAEAQAMLQAEAERVPVPVVVALAALFMWLVFTDTMKDAVPCGGVLFWLLVVSIVPVVGVLMLGTRRVLIHKGVVKHQVGIAAEVGDIMWTPHSTTYYPVLCSFAGVIAGMFGVGGGIVKGPLMLHLGVLPEVAAATSATMILFTACSASVVYITFGGVKWDYAILMIATGFVVTVAGQMLTYHVIAQHGRKSVVVLAMALLLTAGAAIMCYEVFPALSKAESDGFLHGSRICS